MPKLITNKEWCAYYKRLFKAENDVLRARIRLTKNLSM